METKNWVLLAVVAVLAVTAPIYGLRQSTTSEQAVQSSVEVPDLEWPLPDREPVYGAIDGEHLWQYVARQAEFSREYRDHGHPQFWGRIIGSSADSASAEWLVSIFDEIGLSDAHIQPFDLQPQWFPQSWEVTVGSGANALTLETAHPYYRSPGTDGQELDLEAVWVGEGTPADFVGRDVEGKAVFFSSADPPGWCPQCVDSDSGFMPGALERAEENGAAAVFWVYTLVPGNVKYQAYPSGVDIPSFAVGREEGAAVAEMIAQSPDSPPSVRLRMDVDLVPNLRTSLVWGTLPGRTDETIYVIAHRDGFFDAAVDNASGVATMIGLAEYFAQVPRSQRRRTMVFVGVGGHHNSGPGSSVGMNWMADQKDSLFSKTALMINAEHTSGTRYHRYQGEIVETNSYIPAGWYGGGATRPQMQEMVADALAEFGVSAWSEPDDRPPAGDLGRFYTFLPGVVFQTNDYIYFHTDRDSPEAVSASGLQAITRAFAKIIDDINTLDLEELQRPEGTG